VSGAAAPDKGETTVSVHHEHAHTSTCARACCVRALAYAYVRTHELLFPHFCRIKKRNNKRQSLFISHQKTQQQKDRGCVRKQQTADAEGAADAQDAAVSILLLSPIP